MNRRDVLKLALGVAGLSTSLTYADCRDERKMIMPAYDRKCHALSWARHDFEDRELYIANAKFGYDAYEDLLKHQKQNRTYPFEFQGTKHKIRVTRVSVDVDREIGCVVIEVEGRLYWS